MDDHDCNLCKKQLILTIYLFGIKKGKEIDASENYHAVVAS